MSERDMDKGRSKEFAKSSKLEAALAEVNAALAGAPSSQPYPTPRYPTILIMGAPRSGTTLMLQWLAASKAFAYPSNLSARFYSNPYMGARIQQVLADYDTSNQIGLNAEFTYESALGRSDGALAPSEYWYFWRQYFKFGEINVLTEAELAAVDTPALLQGLAGMEAAFDKPFVLKGMMHNWHIPFLDKLLDKVLFLNIERDPFSTAQSLLSARQKFFGDESRWYSFKPPEYETLKTLSPIEQVAGQVVYTRNAIRRGLEAVEDNRKLTIPYEAFCDHPAGIFEAIRGKLASQGYTLKGEAPKDTSFNVTNRVTLNATDADSLKAAITALEQA